MRGLLAHVVLIATMAGEVRAQPVQPREALDQSLPWPHPCELAAACGDREVCAFDVERRICYGTEPYSASMYVGGLVVVGLGGAMSLAGVYLLWVDGAFFAAVSMIPNGVLLTLTVGTPLAVIGARRVPRKRSANVHVELKPGGVALLGSF